MASSHDKPPYIRVTRPVAIENPPAPVEKEPVESAPVEKLSDEPIVMLNPVLKRQAGLKERKVRKSIPNGGTFYKPMVLQELGFEDNKPKASPEMAIEASPSTLEAIYAPDVSPETLAENKESLKKAVTTLTATQIENQVASLRQKIVRAEEEARTCPYKETDRFKARASIEKVPNPDGFANDNHEPDPEERIQRYEAQLKQLYDEKATLDPKYNASPEIVTAATAEQKEEVRQQVQSGSQVSAAARPSRASTTGTQTNSNKKKPSNVRAAIAVGMALAGGGATSLAAMTPKATKAPVAAESTQFEHFDTVKSFVQKGEGPWEMIQKLKAQLAVAFPDQKNAPAAVKHVLETNSHVFAYVYGLASKDGTLVHPLHTGDSPEKADSLSVNDQGQVVFHDGVHNKDHILIQEIASGKMAVVSPLEGKLIAPGHHPHHYQEHHPKASHEAHHPTHHTQPAHSAQETVSPAQHVVPVASPFKPAPSYDVTMHHEPASVTPSERPVAQPAEEHPADISSAAPMPSVAPAERPQAAAAPVEAPESIPYATPSINALTHNDAWTQFNQSEAMNIFNYAAEPGTEAETFRAGFFALLRQSGTGPHDGETLRNYVTRAAELIHEHGGSLEARVAIYQDNGLLVAHDGDLDARLTLAREYIRLNPSSQVIVENPEGATKLILLTSESIKSRTYPGVIGTPPPITISNPVAF